jgi:RNA polymerase sigma-70 factor (ECF subfamily)
MDDLQHNVEKSESELIRTGGQDALAKLLSQHQASLTRIIHFRLDPALRSRIEPEDVLQEAYIEISRRIDEYLAGTPVSFFVWIRQRVLQTLIDLHRRHFSDKRDALRDRPMANNEFGQTSCLSIAQFLLDDRTSPSQAAVRAEEVTRMQAALESMNETDREVLVMRHFEHLNNQQTAEALGISTTAASNRYVRAAAKLSDILKELSSSQTPS